MVVYFLFIITVTFFGVYSEAYVLDEGLQISIAKSPEWQKLLHFTGSKSQIHSQEFFVNINGNKDSLDELRSNIEIFKKDSDYACRFPARAEYLSDILKIEYKKCDQVELWKSDINAESVALVYVTQYVSNPASIFGHNYLLFQNSNRPVNLDVVFNNAAQVPEEVSTYDYVIKGMFGGFPTVYTKEPFYIKIQEYNNIENRDQWIYDLNLSKDQINQLLNHLWELANLKNEDYFFLNINCAFNIYNALAAISPELDFISENKLYVLPVETVKRVNHINSKITYHPSIREKVVQRYRQLPNSDSKSIDEAEIELELFEYKKSQNGGQLSKEEQEAYNKKLVERSKLGRRPQPFKYDVPEYPHAAHPTWNVSLIRQKLETEMTNALSLAPFHHSLLQSEIGFLPHSEIIVFEVMLEQRENEPIYFKKFTFLKMSNFAEISSFDSQYSWQLDSKLRRDKSGKNFFEGLIDIGKSLSLSKNYLLYGLVGLNIDYSQILHPEFRLGILANHHLLNFKFEYAQLQDAEGNNLTKKNFALAGCYQVFKNFDLELGSLISNEKPGYNLKFGYNF